MINLKLMEDFIIFCGDDHIVHVNVEPALCDLFLEYVIYHSLEGSQRVGQAKEHDCWFEESFTSFEGGFILIAFLNVNIVVPPANIKLGE